MKHFYEKNSEFLNSKVNKTFDELLAMSEPEFVTWVKEMRKTVVHYWDTKGQPPRVGYDEHEIVKQFNEMTSFPTHNFLVTDEHTGTDDAIFTGNLTGNAVNQWFPTMMKTRINYSIDSDSGKSIYDYFARDDLANTFTLYAHRHFRRDSFYNYSQTIEKGKLIDNVGGNLRYRTTNIKEFVEWFENNARAYNTHDYWFEPSSNDKEAYSGFNDNLSSVEYMSITRDELLKLNCRPETLANINHGDEMAKYTTRPYENADVFRVRLYKKNQKIFPKGFQAFRVSYCQYAVNFPPLIAKFLYEKYTTSIKDQEQINIYDPSSGWGGRLLGALSIDDNKNINYIGTDPNTDHNIGNGKTKYHDIAEFFNTKTYRATGLFPKVHSYEIFQHGSEEIHKDEKFQKYKGKIDLIFTSPPYFSKEAYSEDDTQSYKKFTTYDIWRDEFLKKTLETCVEWLREDRYLLWNIADVTYSKKNLCLPLEQDSIDILKSLGMEYKGVLKMCLAQMPGKNRVDSDTGVPTTKNFCKINGKWRKYEPIFVFHKKSS